MKHRYSELDAIRGIAALMVVLYHYTVRYGEIYIFPVQPLFNFELGLYGVQLFFIVSGFVIFLTLNKTTRAIDFVVSRFSRLYPPYWFAVILTFLVVSIFSLPGREVTLRTAMINLTMLQDWLRVDRVDGVYWTLAVELSFYIIMFVLFVTKQLKRIEVISTVWLLIIIGLNFLSSINVIQLHGAIKLMLLLEYGNLFIAGIMFYKIMHQQRWVHFAILLLALITEFHMHGNVAWLVALYFAIFLAFTKGFLQIFAIKPLIFLGTISYSLYLIHQNIGYVIIRVLESQGLATPITMLVVPLAISVAIATIMQRYIERPSLNLIRNNWKKYSAFSSNKKSIAVN